MDSEELLPEPRPVAEARVSFDDARFRFAERVALRAAWLPAAWLTVLTLIGGALVSTLVDPAVGYRLLVVNGATAALTLLLIRSLRSSIAARRIQLLIGSWAVLCAVDLFAAGLLSRQQIAVTATMLPLLPLLLVLFLPVPPSVHLAQLVAVAVLTSACAAMFAGVGRPEAANAVMGELMVAGGLSIPGHRLLRQRRLDSFNQLLQIRRLHRASQHGERELRSLNAELRHAARVDALTGVGNRLRLRHDLARLATESGQPLAFILVDVDNFKYYNDEKGHLAGDRVLRRVADALAGTMRAGDRLYRYGGEEFLVILTGVAAGAAFEVAQRLVGTVYELEIPHPHNEQWGRVTISAGIAQRSAASTMRLRDLLRLADEALYAAKAAGRNRVHIGAGGSAAKTAHVGDDASVA